MSDTVVRTLEFGLDIAGTTFDVAIDLWSDGMATTSAKYDHATFDPDWYSVVLVTRTSPTINQITVGVNNARPLLRGRHWTEED